MHTCFFAFLALLWCILIPTMRWLWTFPSYNEAMVRFERPSNGCLLHFASGVQCNSLGRCAAFDVTRERLYDRGKRSTSEAKSGGWQSRHKESQTRTIRCLQISSDCLVGWYSPALPYLFCVAHCAHMCALATLLLKLLPCRATVRGCCRKEGWQIFTAVKFTLKGLPTILPSPHFPHATRDPGQLFLSTYTDYLLFANFLVPNKCLFSNNKNYRCVVASVIFSFVLWLEVFHSLAPQIPVYACVSICIVIHMLIFCSLFSDNYNCCWSGA